MLVIRCGQIESFHENESFLGPSTQLGLSTRRDDSTEILASSSVRRGPTQTLELFPLRSQKQACVDGYTSSSNSDTPNRSWEHFDELNRLTTFSSMSQHPNQCEPPIKSKKRREKMNQIAQDVEDASRRVVPKTSNFPKILPHVDAFRTIDLPSSWKFGGKISSRPEGACVDSPGRVYKLEGYENKVQSSLTVPRKSYASSQSANSPRAQSDIYASLLKQEPVQHDESRTDFGNVKNDQIKYQMEITNIDQTETALIEKDYVFQYYSHQIWLDPPKIWSKQASFISNFLAVDLLMMISNLVSIHDVLDKMQLSHNILFPFTYKLILKGLSQNRWRRIKKNLEIILAPHLPFWCE